MTFASSAVVDIDVARLLAMLRYRRPFASQGEEGFIRRFIDPLEPQVLAGNRVIVVPRPDGTASTTLFSCHTDTVHRNCSKQEVCYDKDLGVIYKEDGEPLGADDGAGVFVLLHMIRNQVPGTYVFHRGEECGGVGSALMFDTELEFLKGFDRAIAFDRKGTEDVITHQACGRCCSTDFAQALADALNGADPSFAYEPCSTGLFTDTANYVDVIPECTNLSVGYEGEHTYGEMLDLGHLRQLAEAACKVDWDALPTQRKAGDNDDLFSFHGWKLGSKHYLRGSNDDDAGLVDSWALAEDAASEVFGELYEKDLGRAYSSIRWDDMVEFCYADPEAVDELLSLLERGIYAKGDDSDVISWVRGY
jgi:hypothetical protein